MRGRSVVTKVAILLMTLGPGGSVLRAQATSSVRPQLAPVGGPGELAVPVRVHEAVPQGIPGRDRIGEVASFGLPFSRGQQVDESDGRPALAVEGSDRWQFTTLDRWPDGSVRWALLDVLADAPAGGAGELVVRRGSGSAGAGLVARPAPQGVLIDTGRLTARLFPEPHQPLGQVTLDGRSLVEAGAQPELIATDLDGTQRWPGPDLTLTIERNGPALAVVRADGAFVDDAGQALLDFTLRITARHGSNALELTLTVRNASRERPLHTSLEGIELVLPTRIRQGEVSLATHGQPAVADIGLGEDALLYQSGSAAAVGDLSPDYRPHVPTLPDDPEVLAEQGYRARIGGELFHDLGLPAPYPGRGWLRLQGLHSGVTAALRDMPYLWPAALEADGAGRVVLGLFTTRNSVPYTWVWQQHESRSAVLAFHGPDDVVHAPDVARRLDVPFAGRATHIQHYDRAGVLPYRLLDIARQDQLYASLGLDHAVSVPDQTVFVTRYLANSTGGGPNNHAAIERQLVGEWLRAGVGGPYRNALDLALYKSEWQIRRSDDHDFDPELVALNDEWPHTTGNFGDDEHRYRSGLVLAWYLTGDTRFRDALLDEAEVLRHVSLWPHERSTYQTLRALAWVGAATGDPALAERLEQAVALAGEPIVDASDAADHGWEAAPDAGARRYYVHGPNLDWEKPPGESFQARGFISGSFGPLAWYEAATALPVEHPLRELARGRLRDLAFWTREELFPAQQDPAERRLVYSYAVTLQQVVSWEPTHFHPILLGMAEAWVDTGDVAYLKRGIQQLEAFAVHDDLGLIDARLDCQHFLALLADWLEEVGAL